MVLCFGRRASIALAPDNVLYVCYNVVDHAVSVALHLELLAVFSEVGETQCVYLVTYSCLYARSESLSSGAAVAGGQAVLEGNLVVSQCSLRLGCFRALVADVKRYTCALFSIDFFLLQPDFWPGYARRAQDAL